jgi:hypothetical protein
MTILYNTQTQKILGYFNPQYLVDGQPGNIDPPIIELEYLPSSPPPYDSNTQKITNSWEIKNNQYIQNWTILNLTPEELEQIRINKIPLTVTRRQLKLGMVLFLNLNPNVIDSMIESTPDETEKLTTKILWEDAGMFEISHPLVVNFSQQLGLTQRQLEDFFTQCGGL